MARIREATDQDIILFHSNSVQDNDWASKVSNLSTNIGCRFADFCFLEEMNSEIPVHLISSPATKIMTPIIWLALLSQDGKEKVSCGLKVARNDAQWPCEIFSPEHSQLRESQGEPSVEAVFLSGTT